MGTLNKLISVNKLNKNGVVEGRVALDKDDESVKIKKLIEQDDVNVDTSDELSKDDSLDDSVDKEYIGKTEDNHYYMITNGGSGDSEPNELQIVDQNGDVKLTSKDYNIDASDPVSFIVKAIEEVEIDEITRSVFVKYFIPLLDENGGNNLEKDEDVGDDLDTSKNDEFDRDEDESLDDEPIKNKSDKFISDVGEGKVALDKDDESVKIKKLIETELMSKEDIQKKIDSISNGIKSNKKPGESISIKTIEDIVEMENKSIDLFKNATAINSIISGVKNKLEKDGINVTESKNLIEKVITFNNKKYDVKYVDNNDSDILISINGHEYRFDRDLISYLIDDKTGELTDDDLERLANLALSSMKPEEINELGNNEFEKTNDDNNTSESKVRYKFLKNNKMKRVIENHNYKIIDSFIKNRMNSNAGVISNINEFKSAIIDYINSSNKVKRVSDGVVNDKFLNLAWNYYNNHTKNTECDYNGDIKEFSNRGVSLLKKLLS